MKSIDDHASEQVCAEHKVIRRDNTVKPRPMGLCWNYIKHIKLRKECIMEKCQSILDPPPQKKKYHTCRDRQFPFG